MTTFHQLLNVDPRTSSEVIQAAWFRKETMPHDILKTQRLIIKKDPRIVGSRMLLFLFRKNVPNCYAGVSRVTR